MSWDDAFSLRYDEWSAHMTADIGFCSRLALEADGLLVELAIGNARVAVPVAQATGRQVVGVDTSLAMLEQARARAAKAGVDLDLRHADMRDLRVEEQAALIYCPFRALLHLPNGRTGDAPSSGWRRRSAPAAGSPTRVNCRRSVRFRRS